MTHLGVGVGQSAVQVWGEGGFHLLLKQAKRQLIPFLNIRFNSCALGWEIWNPDANCLFAPRFFFVTKQEAHLLRSFANYCFRLSNIKFILSWRRDVESSTIDGEEKNKTSMQRKNCINANHYTLPAFADILHRPTTWHVIPLGAPRIHLRAILVAWIVRLTASPVLVWNLRAVTPLECAFPV